jgi:hypothetical protein
VGLGLLLLLLTLRQLVFNSQCLWGLQQWCWRETARGCMDWLAEQQTRERGLAVGQVLQMP